MLEAVMDEPLRERYAQSLECDFASDFPALCRFRVNAFQTHRGAAAVFRAIPAQVRTLAQLGAPTLFADLALRPRGLVLVTGPTGSGKSTTLAAMVRHLNETQARHILTVEDPIEFVHLPARSLINQREVGAHTRSFANALRSALREDPDVILLGEMRDLETIRLALTAAETGHLVLGTLHTSSAPQAIDRVIDVFPAGEKDMARAMLSESLLAVVAQVLCRKADTSAPGRVAAYEIMTGTPAIRHLIREGKVAQMHASLQTGAATGMRTLDQHLMELVRQGTIGAAEARRHARQVEGRVA
jgi:twitching motility protein PilT